MPWNPHLCTAFHQQLHVPPLSSLLGAPGSVWPVHPSNTLHWIPQALTPAAPVFPSRQCWGDNWVEVTTETVFLEHLT